MEQASLQQPVESAATTQLMSIALLRQELAGLMQVQGYRVLRPPDEVISFLGRLQGDTEATFEEISKRFGAHGYTASLREQPGGAQELMAIKGRLERRPGGVWTNIILFLFTLVSVLYIGAMHGLSDAGIEIGEEAGPEVLFLPLRYIRLGLPFAGTLLGILLAHELSHYFVARRYGSPVSLPYFIPMPLPPMGTMGAVIVQRAPMRSRKAIFDIGVAGPLGGLIVAIPLLILGLSLSKVGPPPPDVKTALQEGNSLLYLVIKYLMFGKILPSNGEDVWLHSVAFAAWAGLLVTMINLMPIGQLDGGHIAYALLGQRSKTLGYFVIVAMLLWGGWMLTQGNEAGGFWLAWGFLNMVLNQRHPPPLDDATPVDGRRLILGLFMLLVFILTFIPAPLREVRFG